MKETVKIIDVKELVLNTKLGDIDSIDVEGEDIDELPDDADVTIELLQDEEIGAEVSMMIDMRQISLPNGGGGCVEAWEEFSKDRKD